MQNLGLDASAIYNLKKAMLNWKKPVKTLLCHTAIIAFMFLIKCKSFETHFSMLL